MSFNTAPKFVNNTGDGIVITDVGGGFDVANSTAIQADGKLVTAGYSNANGAFDFALVRYNPDGSLDASFGNQGKVLTDLAGPDDYAMSIVVQADGKLVAAGTSNANGTFDFALIRYNPDGSLDTAFGNNGTVFTDLGQFHLDQALSIVVQADDKLVAGGLSSDGFSLVRYNPDGSLDTSFGNGGKVITYLGQYAFTKSLVIQADGKLVQAGYIRNGGDTGWDNGFALVRYNADGSLDTTFGNGGKVYTDIGVYDYANSVALQSDGKLVVTGFSIDYINNPNGNVYITLARYNLDGSLDSTFGDQGKVSTDLYFEPYHFSQANSMVVQADGKLVVAGTALSSSDNMDFALVRYNPDGSLDNSFGNNGRVITDLGGSYHDWGLSLIMQADGKLVVTGYTGSIGNYDFALARYNPDGSLDTTFSSSTSLTETVLDNSVWFQENQSAVILDQTVHIDDAELSALGSYEGAILTLSRVGGANADDVFSAASGGALTTLNEGGSFSVDNITIGQVTVNSQGVLTLIFNSQATVTLVNKALQQIAYANTSDIPHPSVQIHWMFSDGNTGVQGSGGALSVSGTTTVNIIPVNDAPSGVDTTVTINTEYSVLTTDAFGFTDTDGNQLLSVKIDALPAWGQLMYNGVVITASQIASGFEVSVNDIVAGKLTYKADMNASGTAYAYLQFQVRDNGGTLNGGIDMDPNAHILSLLLPTRDQILTGTSGNDVLIGNAGNDTLDGGAGADTLIGGLGNDTYVVDNNGDSVIELANAGTDTVQSSISYTLGDNLENLTLTGLADINGIGNNLDNLIRGNAGINTLIGGAGNDTYLVDNNGDSVIELANAGIDTVQSSISYTLGDNLENLDLMGSASLSGSGNDLNNTIIGNSGNNILNGAVGADTLNGGQGDDTYMVDNVGDSVMELANAGIDTVQSSISYTLGDNLENLVLIGIANLSGSGNGLNNTLTGNSGNNLLDGGVGTDTLIGGLGNDTYVVDNNGDSVMELANAGTDTVQSSISYTLGVNLENLILTGLADINGIGNTLTNTLTGNSGNNLLDGGVGADTLIGGLGNDTYVVDNNGDNVIELANAGSDTVQSSISYTLRDNLENLVLMGGTSLSGIGNSLNNTLMGNSGNNTLNGAVGADTLNGGLGNDTYVVDNNGDNVIESANAGTDTVQSSISYTLRDNLENLVLTGTANLSGNGNDLNNSLTGNSGNNLLDGGVGADTLIGGLGNDTYVVDNNGDNVIESANAGTDIVQSSISNTLGVNLENLILTGLADINGIGNTLANTLTGNSGNNTLDGGVGADTLIGGLGNDTYVVDNVGDNVIESANAGIDTVQSSISYTLGDNLENLVITGSANLSGSGNGLNNTLMGNSRNNLLDGGAGADTLIGGMGNDTYVVDNVGDSVIELANAGIDTVQSSISYTLGDNLENLSLIGLADINGNGNDLNNTLIGNSGNNLLDGEASADTLIGGQGNDTYVVDNVSDSVMELANAGSDTVQSSISYTLGVNLENLILTGLADTNGTGNVLANTLTGNSGNNTLTGGVGNDILIGGNGADTLLGGLGADNINLSESVASTDIVRSVAGDSQLTAYDVISGFAVGSSAISSAGVDKLDLPKTLIAGNVDSVNGLDVGVIKSHQITNGIISFGSTNSFSGAVDVNTSNLLDVLNYVQANITQLGTTVAFNTATDAYVFQDGGANTNDTLIELAGVHLNSINTTGLNAGSLWLV